MTAGSEELRRQRAEIEKRVSQRAKEVQGPVDSPAARFPTEKGTPEEAPVESPPSKAEESALARIKREREEKRTSDTPTDEDVEMVSVGGQTGEDEAVAAVPERLVSRRSVLSKRLVDRKTDPV